MKRLDYLLDLISLVILMATLYGLLIVGAAIEGGAL